MNPNWSNKPAQPVDAQSLREGVRRIRMEMDNPNHLPHQPRFRVVPHWLPEVIDRYISTHDDGHTCETLIDALNMDLAYLNFNPEGKRVIVFRHAWKERMDRMMEGLR